MSANIELTVQVEDEETLKAPGSGDAPLFITNWFKVTEQLSRTYLLRVRVLAGIDNLDLASLVGRRMALTETRTLDGSATPSSRIFKGVIWGAQQRGMWRSATGDTYYYYWLDVRPALQSLAMSARSRVYGTDQPRSIPEIVNFCLTGSYGDTTSSLEPGIKGTIDYQAEYQNPDDYTISSMMKDFLVQYNETDLDFIQRLMERWGIFYFIDPYQDAALDTEQMMVTDYNAPFKYVGNAPSIDQATTLQYVQPNKYAPGSTFLVKNFIARHSLRPTTLTLDDYNYRTASAQLTVEQPLDGSAGEGTLTSFGQNFRSTGAVSDGHLLAERHAELVMCDQNYFTGQSDCFELIPGFIFALEGHFNSAYNTDRNAKSTVHMHGYLVTEVAHECSIPLPGQSWNDDDYGHSADFTAIECCVPYRAPRVTPVPKVPGVISATIDASDDTDRAALDDQGRYLAWLKFDGSGLPDGQHSAPIRMAQPYGGLGGGGLMFPLVKETEVLISFVNGDLDRPVITGAVPNSSNPSPVAAANQTRNRIVTDSAITLELEDGAASSSASAAVAAPPAGSLPTRTAHRYEPVGTSQLGREAGASTKTAGEGETTLQNWARLYLTQGGETSYLRMGAVPSDETSTRLAGTGGADLPQEPGWLDYTDGDRASGTAGSKTETVGGDLSLTVTGAQKLAVEGGGSITPEMQAELADAQEEVYALDDSVSVPTTDPTRLVEVVSGGQERVVFEGDAQDYVLQGNRTEYTEGHHLSRIMGNSYALIDGSYSVDYKKSKWSVTHGNSHSKTYGNSYSKFYGKKVSTHHGRSESYFMGGKLSMNLAGSLTLNGQMDVNFAVGKLYFTVWQSFSAQFNVSTNLIHAAEIKLGLKKESLSVTQRVSALEDDVLKCISAINTLFM